MKLKSKFSKSLKSQSALEFLTTYGWAFLVILIMIGTLAYFGILSPSKVLPNRCTFSSEFQCLDYQIKYGTDGTDGEFKVRLKNNVGEPISIDAGQATISTESVGVFTCGTPPGAQVGWKAGEIKELKWTGCNTKAVGLFSGEKGKVLVKLRFYSLSSGVDYSKESQGEVYAGVI